MKKTNIGKMKYVLKIQSDIRKLLGEELRKKNFIEISPVILSPITDPLNHPTMPANINCYGKSYRLTQSMIFHKQAALNTLEKIFVFSPNVRLESLEKRYTRRHLFEFIQLDVEIKYAKREDVMDLCEELLISIIKYVKKNCKTELKILKRELKVPKIPFKKIRYGEAYRQYGKEFEKIISKNYNDPVWIIDMPLGCREFYDREDPKRPGVLLDMDLIYPESYGEALSGGEREYEYELIKQRIIKKGLQLSNFKEYLNIAKRNFYPSGGFGIGLERLTLYICGLKRIEESTLFPKTPGNKCI